MALVSLAGLEKLTSVGDFSIYGNTALKTLRALSALSAIRGSFFVDLNTALPTCDIERLRDRIGSANVGTTSFIGNDDAGTCAP